MPSGTFTRAKCLFRVAAILSAVHRLGPNFFSRQVEDYGVRSEGLRGTNNFGKTHSVREVYTDHGDIRRGTWLGKETRKRDLERFPLRHDREVLDPIPTDPKSPYCRFEPPNQTIPVVSGFKSRLTYICTSDLEGEKKVGK